MASLTRAMQSNNAWNRARLGLVSLEQCNLTMLGTGLGFQYFSIGHPAQYIFLLCTLTPPSMPSIGFYID